MRLVWLPSSKTDSELLSVYLEQKHRMLACGSLANYAHCSETYSTSQKLRLHSKELANAETMAPIVWDLHCLAQCMRQKSIVLVGDSLSRNHIIVRWRARCTSTQ
jgi:hypothetical protein